MGGGTEAFPDLGAHCEHSDCHQLDFLPFNCDGCRKVFCLEHRSYKSHHCPKSDHNSRRVLVCQTCSTSIETTGQHDDDKALLEAHKNSGTCDPAKNKKPTCPVRRCKEVLTFSNTSTCKTCHLKVCLKHRFPADHACRRTSSSKAASSSVVGGNGGWWNNKFLEALASRKGKDCSKATEPGSVSPPSTPSVKAC
ncbi:zinc finger AN1 domain-containing stress-associated protein 12 [Ziziphus jujuba]|uniref:Zinc finger AN1 domain-containing stress-associated protein 12 n=2 Tax=Ziziphus jujuba TaxID=326968 RepID=A0A6P4A080_ZIZJJ|nr:zinc finger AN1 domain-containing stress-associated protein 12 [Ziziphus jujuba]KAH7532558.1 hypothetical protein FEM48_Zijuj04G0033100 [Ziziphus jujuba var. spinosa]